ncbi:hypothetical protein EW146_g2594 [Bondarzewia mesenterica]|uniref:Uncharacterized protein n=1 Tax=Bondarzewia mesenterica TaxID=1095465 RepID=A0A4S4M2G9_9AGAM|nr:hypothetical protein EW146_g2594 [Bondarzewia mesenterica]
MLRSSANARLLAHSNASSRSSTERANASFSSQHASDGMESSNKDIDSTSPANTATYGPSSEHRCQGHEEDGIKHTQAGTLVAMLPMDERLRFVPAWACPGVASCRFCSPSRFAVQRHMLMCPFCPKMQRRRELLLREAMHHVQPNRNPAIVLPSSAHPEQTPALAQSTSTITPMPPAPPNVLSGPLTVAKIQYYQDTFPIFFQSTGRQMSEERIREFQTLLPSLLQRRYAVGQRRENLAALRGPQAIGRPVILRANAYRTTSGPIMAHAASRVPPSRAPAHARVAVCRAHKVLIEEKWRFTATFQK